MYEADYVTVPVAAEGAEYQPEQIPAIVAELEGEMKKAARAMEFEKAAQLRDRILGLKDLQLGLPRQAAGMKGLLGSGALAGAAAVGALRGQRRSSMRRRRR
jgi:excinuclease ABC subunit B